MGIEFEPLAEARLPLVAEWLRRPHVREWWGRDEDPRTVAQLRGHLLSHPQSTVRGYIAVENGLPIGFVQSYVAMGSGGGWWEEETDPGVMGVDQFVADGTRLGQGLGTRMVRAFVEGLLADPAVTRVQTDPDPANARAIRCYEKAGFRRVRDITTPDGAALLMTADAGSLARLEAFHDEQLSDLVRIWRGSFEHGLGIVDPNPIERQERYFLDEVLAKHTVRVAMLAGRIVGFVAATPESIAQLFVRREFLGRGIGSRLLEWAKNQSSGSLWLYTFARNAGARAFYERRGFVATAFGHEPHWKLDDVRYEWRYDRGPKGER